jgi:putative ABC transport system substrate-binding protein
MSYGTDLPASYRQAAIYAARILKGENPANLPVVQPTKFHAAVNTKTAKSLGIELPPRLLSRMSAFGGKADMTCCGANVGLFKN